MKDRDWISVEEKLPELTESIKVGHKLNEYNEKDSSLWGTFVVDLVLRQSKEVIVAEQKGNCFEEDVGWYTKDGWATTCDNVTHWCEK